jgi:uncharacterized protein YjbI with pentapeptide repeats
LRPDVRFAMRQSMEFLAENTMPLPAFATPHRWTEPSGGTGEPDAGEEVADARLGEIVSDEEIGTPSECRKEGHERAAALLQRYASGERDFRDGDFQGQSLAGVDLSGSDLRGADLSGCNLTNAVLTEADLREADLQRALLRGAVLHKADLRNADLSRADLSSADLSGADIRHADFSHACLQQAMLVGTQRNMGTDLTGVDVSQIVCDADLQVESLRGLSANQIFAEKSGLAGRVGLSFVLAGIAFALFGTAGTAIGALLDTQEDSHRLRDAVGLWSGAVGALIVLMLLLWPRRG